MTPGEAISQLATWTPFLLGGFAWNIVVSLVAMTIGTILGALLALGRAGRPRHLTRAAELATHVARNIPTFVFLYYLAYLLPFELQLGERVLVVPAWLKAALALSVAVTGFVSDNGLDALRCLRRGDLAAAMLFIPNWTMYFVIIVMASSTASVIGVPELVSRANTIIAAVGEDAFMFWVYAWAMLLFFAFCMPLTWLMRRVRERVALHAARPVGA